MPDERKPDLSLVSPKDRAPHEIPPLWVQPFATLFNRPTSKPEWLIEGLIPKGTTFCLNGRGGIWKSWTFTAMGICVAACGPKFLNHFRCPRYSALGNSVLFIQLEETADEAAAKAQWIARGLELKPQQIQDLLFHYIV